MPGLTQPEIYKIVFDYIGVKSDYLGDFTYASHQEFYPRYCDLAINPNVFEGTTKERFLAIIENADALTQSKIIRGLLAKYRPTRSDSGDADIVELREELEAMAARIESEDEDGPKIQNPTLNITSEVVNRALRDADALLENQGPVSGIDRIHTALHAYLTEACRREKLLAAKDASLPTIFNMLVRQHPAFSGTASRDGDILKILRSFGAVLDSLGPIRNMASMAHPNDELLGRDEAMLVVHAGWTILHYVDSKIAAWASGT